MKPSKVTKIPVSNIEPNPHNPRRIFDEEPMEILLESIRKVGILVPITVYLSKVKDKVDISRDEFILLDGERRWRCAKKLGMDSIPAIIVERPTKVQNILTMFHIHNIREPWMLMPTALTLQALMEHLGEKNERKLSELTRLSISQVRRCKILLSYPKKFQNMLLAPPSDRVKADFFIELRGIREPARKEKYPFWVDRGDKECIDIFLKKYLRGVIKSVTEPRKIVEIYKGSLRIDALDEFSNEMVKFLDDPEMTIDDIFVYPLGPLGLSGNGTPNLIEFPLSLRV